MRLTSQRLMLAASAAVLIAACAKKTDDAATTDTEAVEPMAEAETDTDSNQVGTANVVIGMQNGAPYFSQASEGFCIPGGGCAGGIVMNSGDIDLSGFPPGDVLVTVTLNSDASGAGYRFASDSYQAIAIVVTPPGISTPPPQFGQQYWPSDFDPPSVSGDQVTLTFVDEEEDSDLYEYSIGLNGPNGRVVMDPTIKNGGVPPEPVPTDAPVPR